MNISKPVKLHLSTVYRQLYCANADDIGVNLLPVKIKHMANHSKVCCDQRYQDKIAHWKSSPGQILHTWQNWGKLEVKHEFSIQNWSELGEITGKTWPEPCGKWSVKFY